MTLLKSLNQIKNEIDFEVTIVGRGKLKNKLQNYIDSQNLKKSIKLHDFVENPYPLIRQSDLFVLSSKFEGLPNVLL